MTAKHGFVDDYPYLVYSSKPDTSVESGDAALDARLDAIEADGWVTTDRIASKAVTGAKMADGTVDTGQLKDDAVTTAKIKDGAVTADKLAQ